jgi:AraC family transcriptional regulator
MQSGYERQMLRVLDRIHEDPAADLSLDALAEVATMSRYHWHRVFRAVTGETLAEAVRRIRLHRAACWLMETDMALPEVARRAGYGSPRSLSRAFRLQYGLTPAAFRARGVFVPASQQCDSQAVRIMFPVEIQVQPARRLATIPHQGPYPDIGRAFDRLHAVLAEKGVADQVRGMGAVFFDDPASVAPSKLTSAAGAEIGEDFAIEAPLQEVRLPAGRHAVMRVTGPYSQLTDAYDALYCTWLPTSGEKPGPSPAFEVYRNTPRDTRPDALLTDIMLPLA